MAFFLSSYLATSVTTLLYHNKATLSTASCAIVDEGKQELNAFYNSGYTVNVTGGSYKVQENTDSNKISKARSMFMISGATATFDGVEIENDYNGSIYAMNKAGVTVKGDTKINITGSPSAVSGYSWGVNAVSTAYGGTLTVEDGTYTTSGYGGYIYSSGGGVNVKGGTWTQTENNTYSLLMVDFDSSTYTNYYKSGTTPSNVAVTGGNFNLATNAKFLAGSALNNTNSKVEITGGTFQSFDEIPAGYGYKEVNGKYQIVPVAKIGNQTYATLADAFAVANGDSATSTTVIQLLANVNIDTSTAAIEIKKATKFNLGGFNITSTATNTFNVTGGSFTLAGSGTIEQTVAGSVVKATAGFTMDSATAYIKNTATTGTEYYAVEISGATANILNGNITSTYGGIKLSNSATANIYNGSSISVTGTTKAIGVLVDGASTLNFGRGQSTDAETIKATASNNGQAIAISNTGTGTVKIADGTITASGGEKDVGILQTGTGTLTVNSGTITGGNEAVAAVADDPNTDEDETIAAVAASAGTGVEVHAGKFRRCIHR